ncbi:MAG: biotin--[acetyl-CoA-carboxylase] ligase [Nitrospirae bacterium]|nr:biotin--[acetyl-CoA-carboxylase] ligase [Nitrospirota bacterium]
MKGQIIKFLRENKGTFVSGEEISRFIGVSRAAVWKTVKTLRRSHYLIEAIPSRGYKLISSPDTPSREEISAVFSGDIVGREIKFYGTTTSTNDRAMEAGKDGREGTVFIADSQVQGRGRFGREWISPPGVNLYFSVLLKPGFSPQEASVLTLMAAVAATTAIRGYTGLNAEIKWPNDILINGRKAGGILTEMKSDMDSIEAIALGIGINVNMSLRMMPVSLRPLATSLKIEKGEAVNRVELLGEILSTLEYWYKRLLHGDKKALLSEWVRMDAATDKKISIRFQDSVLNGIAGGIGEDGELIVRLPSGSTEKVYAGEVTILKN